MDKDWKKRLGVVYSTSEDFNFEYDSKEEKTIAKNQQQLYVTLDKKNRKGKAVTLISGFKGSSDELKDLGKYLKGKCGVGGSVKDREILLQGDHREKVIGLLEKDAYKVKRSGG
jgi:translation initiation factor 1